MEEIGEVLPGERADGQLGAGLRAEVDPGRYRTRAVGPLRGQNTDREVGYPPGDEAQHAGALLIDPLEIVNYQQYRPVGGEHPQQLQHCEAYRELVLGGAGWRG